MFAWSSSGFSELRRGIVFNVHAYNSSATLKILLYIFHVGARLERFGNGLSGRCLERKRAFPFHSHADAKGVKRVKSWSSQVSAKTTTSAPTSERSSACASGRGRVIPIGERESNTLARRNFDRTCHRRVRVQRGIETTGVVVVRVGIPVS